MEEGGTRKRKEEREKKGKGRNRYEKEEKGRKMYQKHWIFNTSQKKHIKSVVFLIHGRLMYQFLRGSFPESELPLS